MKKVNILIVVILLLTSMVLQAAEVAGKVGYMSGTLVAQRGDGTLQVLRPKSKILTGDMLVTARNSYAQLLMNDGGKITLRPNSNFKIVAFKYNKKEPKADNALFSLLKGGFRALTGLIGKRGNQDAYRVDAASATIGIRGTDFSALLCFTKNCLDENKEKAKKVVKPSTPKARAIGRVMLVQGKLAGKSGSGKSRKLRLGSSVYEGDTLSTGKKSYAVVAFRDEGRVSLQADTIFQVEKFKYNKKSTEKEENAVLHLFKGGVRVVTGWIGRLNRDNYKFKIANATIGIRGTGFDVWCNGPCAAGADNPGATQDNPLDGAGVYVWSGEVVLVTPGGSFLVAIQQAAMIARDTGKPVSIMEIPAIVIDNDTPRPDGIPVDFEKLFSDQVVEEVGPGLYVTVHDGKVILASGGRSLDLGVGKTGFSAQDILLRLDSRPSFMQGESLGGVTTGGSHLDQNDCVIQ
jgi:hypothetical protein